MKAYLPTRLLTGAAAALAASTLTYCTDPPPADASPVPVARYVAELRQDLRRFPPGRFNPALACYVDLTRPDNAYRFFLLDLDKAEIKLQGLCLNGRTDAAGRVRYSNAEGSNCSSRGLAYVGGRYFGSFGLARHLHGLDPETSNLRQRAVVLHSWAGVPAAPGWLSPIQSQGCPTLHPAVLGQVDAYLRCCSPLPVLIRLH